MSRKKGRPLKGHAPLDVSLTIRLSEREAQNLAYYAFRHDMSMGDVIRDALDILSISGL
jgi:hypothetical protein